MALATKKVGEYEFIPSSDNIIGKGSFGVVYKGNHTTSKTKKVAIKQVKLHHKEEDKAIFNEVSSIDCLHSHRNVIKLLSAQMNILELECWLVMELCEMGDLQNYLKNNKENLTMEDKLYFMYQAVLPIVFMHEQNPPIIHRDIKPGNYLLKQGTTKEDIILKVTDFGLAKLFDRSKASDTIMLTTQCGTQPYMAPEFWVDGDLDYDKTVDTYALGLMFLVILEARKDSKDIPLTAESKKHGFYGFVGQEMQRCYKKGIDMPLVVDIKDNDPEELTDIKFMINDMIDYCPANRIALNQVQKKLESRLGDRMKTIPPPINTNSQELGPESGIDMDYVLDSIGYSMVQNTTDDSAYESKKKTGGTSAQKEVKKEVPMELMTQSIVERLRGCLQSVTVYGSVFKGGDTVLGQKFACDDVVRVLNDAAKVQKEQEQLGQWSEEMKTCVGFPGVITGVEEKCSRVRFINQKTFTFSNQVLQKEVLDLTKLSGGDYVVIKSDRQLVKKVQSNLTPAMQQMVGQPGIVRCVRGEKVKIEHSGTKNFFWSIHAIILVAKCEEIVKLLLQN